MNAIEYIKGLQDQVDPKLTEGMESIFHFILTDEDNGELTVKVNDGDIQVLDGLHDEAKCTVKTKSSTFEKLINNKLNPMMAVLTGKVKISNQSELIKFAKVFGVM